MPEGTFTLAKAISHFFEIPASEMVKNFKALTDKDKVDLQKWLEDAGYTIVRPA